MSISHSIEKVLTCPNCGGTFRTQVWVILDAQEQPMHTQELHQGQLNMATCPQCNQVHSVGTGLLFHDRQARCVIFAVPSQQAEHVWREQAREVHALLIERIPAEQRLPYVSDVDIAHDLAGVARMHAKARRRYTTTLHHPSVGQHTSQPVPTRIQETREPYHSTQPAPTLQQTPTDHTSVLQACIQQLMTATTHEAIMSLVDRTPLLLDPSTDQALHELATIAFEQRDYDIVECLSHIRQTLNQIRTTDSQYDRAIPDHSTHHEMPHSQKPDTIVQAYEALLHARHQHDLDQALQSYPELLEPWFDAMLDEECHYALEDGYERLALVLVHRHVLISELR